MAAAATAQATSVAKPAGGASGVAFQTAARNATLTLAASSPNQDFMQKAPLLAATYRAGPKRLIARAGEFRPAYSLYQALTDAGRDVPIAARRRTD